jgi:hypothetical protein
MSPNLTRRTRHILLAATLFFACAPVLGAQSVRGRFTDEATRQGIQGALVVLLDEAGIQRAGSLTSEAGDFAITAPAAGRYRLRAQRIGYADAGTAPFLLEAGQTVEQALSSRPSAIALDEISVQARRRCMVRPGDGQVLGELWQEARKALSAAAFTEGERLFGYQFRTYRRQLDPSSLRVVREYSELQQRYMQGSPFVSLPVGELISSGFIQQRPGEIDYYAPDATALLSDEFLDDYCLGLTAGHPENSGVVGITFAPVASRGPAALRGTLWIDRATRELRWLEYRYTRTSSPVFEDHRIGGRVEFEALPSGAWIVRRWWIRMPTGRAHQPLIGSPGVRAQELFGGILEEGGEVVEIRSTRGVTRSATAGTLTGIVFDSARAAPLVGALVFISGTSYSATTDADGRFEIEQLPQGRYDISFSHPDLARAGIHLPPEPVSMDERGHADIALSVPTSARRDAALAACPSSDTTAGRGVARGRVLDLVTRVPLARARVDFSWVGGAGATTVSGADGAFLVCGIPADRPVSARATFMGQSGERAEVVDLGAMAYAEVELAVAITRTEAVTLLVRDWDTGRPIAEAIVALPDLGRQSISDSEGRVRLEGLLAGHHRIEVRHLGYGTQQDRLVVEPGQTQLELRLSPRAIAIEGVTALARSAAEEARRRSGSRQTLLVREDLAAIEGSTRNLGDIARRMPGLRVRHINEGGGTAIPQICIESGRGTMRDNLGDECSEPVMVVLDGMPIFEPWRLSSITPSEIESIQYMTSAEAGGRFGMGSARGVLIIYTRGNGPFVGRR